MGEWEKQTFVLLMIKRLAKTKVAKDEILY